MTKILETVCKTIVVIISTIFLLVTILTTIVLGIIGLPFTIFPSKFDGGVKEYFSQLFNEIILGVKDWWKDITVFCAKD